MPTLNSSVPTRTFAGILLPMDLEPDTENRVRLATDLVDRFSSRLIGVAARPIATPMYFETPVAGIASMLEIEERRAKEDLAKAEAAFRKIVGNRNDIEWRQAITFPLVYALENARAADLIVAARPHRDDETTPMSVDGGDLVMDAGRPVLFVPPKTDWLSAKRIVVGWKDAREARRAVHDALPFLKAAEEVLVVSAETEGRAAKDVVAHLTRHGVVASAQNEPKPLHAVADELLRIAEEEAADLIVCGAYGHSRTREWVFGGVTRDLLDHGRVCCLMAR